MGDELILRQILPPEVWRNVLLKVEEMSTPSLQACSNATTFFRHLMRDRRTLFLFPEVVECLNSQTGVAVQPFAQSILNCRVVCRSWNNNIEQVLEDPNTSFGRRHFSLENFPSPSPPMCSINLEGSPYTYKRLKKFIREFQHTHFGQKNPFPGRQLDIQFDKLFDFEHPENEYEENTLRRIRAFIDILSRYGHEIWYCRLINLSSSDCFEDFYMEFYNMITKMSNLKSLYISMVTQAPPGGDEEESWEEYFNAIDKHIVENPMPTLKDLKYFSSECLSTPISNHIVARNPQVTSLQINRGYMHGREYNYKWVNNIHSLPQLERLAINNLSSPELNELNRFGKTRKLQVLQLTGISDKLFDWRKVVQITAGSRDTLRESLDLPVISRSINAELLFETSRLQTIVQFHTLESLTLRLTRPLQLDWILLPLKNHLKRLHLTLGQYYYETRVYSPARNSQTIQVIDYEKNMTGSNIWEIMGKLKVVRVEVKNDEHHIPNQITEYTRPK